jgi:hypothetical protein
MKRTAGWIGPLGGRQARLGEPAAAATVARSAPSDWPGEVCKRCRRRNCVGFDIPNETWAAVSRGRWNVLCTTCFDEEAQALGIPYSFGEVWPVSWSDWTAA